MGLFIEDLTLGAVQDWFSRTAPSDMTYLEHSFERMAATYEFAKPSLGDQHQVILDVGAHWLHQAFIYANAGHKLICADVPNTSENPGVLQVAAAIGAEMIAYRRLDKGEGICDLPENSIDMVLFSEIIEHLAFNPIPMWRAIYDRLKPGGRIIITTPNSINYRSVRGRLEAMLNDACFGCPVDEIMSNGTYGHHWKEFSLKELRAYFAMLSPDFEILRYAHVGGNANDEKELAWYLSRTSEEGRERIIGETIRSMHARDYPLLGMNLLVEVQIREKARGIVIQPPWEAA